MAQLNIRALITAEDRASRQLQTFAGNVSRLGNSVGNVAKRIAQAGTATAVAFTTLGVKTAADLESARQGFITLLGSADKADATLARIKEEAKRTPFEITGLTQATQMLAAVTKDGDKAIDIILDVGEGLAAMGRGQAELDRISVNLQQIAASGRAAMIDIKQFAFAGIPIFEMLQEETGKSGEALEEFIAEGGVTFDLLTKMFDTANDKGGRFFNAFKNQTGTFNQQWSNLKDTLAITGAEIVTQTGLFDFLKRALEGVGNWFTNNRDTIVGTLKAIQENLGNFIKAVIAFAKPILDELAGAFRNNREQLIQVGKAALTVGKFLAGGFVMFIVGLAQAIRGLMAFIGGLVRVFNFLRDTVKSAREVVKRFFETIGRPVAIVIGPAMSALATLTATLKGVITLVDRLLGRQAQLQRISPSTIGAEVRRRSGGMVRARQGLAMVRVGEEGAENVILPTGSRVQRNTETKLTKSSSSQLHVHFHGPFIGDSMEARKYAKIVVDNIKTMARSKGMTPQEMLS